MKLPIAAALVLALSSAPALAEKPEWAGEKGKGHGKGHKKHKFERDQRGQVRAYYDEEFRRGHCPPGLAKKNNGCMPPGQAKKWSVGRPLPSDVVVYDVPHDLQIRIGLPPAGHKYVRVAADILLIAIGSKIVVDAVRDLGRA
jgi:Ni/Co efflux regulator RcnB